MRKKFPSQTARKFIRNTILLTVAAFALCAWPAARLAADCIPRTTWIGGTGSWFDSSKWSNGMVPDCSTNAQINDGTAQINAKTVASACTLTLGFNTADSGSVSVDDANLTTCKSLSVGYQGTGMLTVTDAGTVTTDQDASIASLAGDVWVSNGSATVDGVGSAWTISGEADVGGTTSGAGGTGLLTVTNSGHVTAASVKVWNSGTLTGNGTVTTTSGTTIYGTLQPSGGRLTIGGDLGFVGTSPLMETNVVPSSADNVSASGVASLAGKISVTMTGSTFTAGTTYTLLHADGGFDPNHRQFPFSSIKGGSGDCFTPVITYDTNNNNVNLYLSPCSN